MGIASTDDLRLFLDVRDSVSEELLQTILDAATDLCQQFTGRVFEPTGTPGEPVSMTFSSEGQGFVTIPDLRQAITVTFEGSLVPEFNGTDPGYILEGEAPYTEIWLEGVPFARTVHRNDLVIEGVWGHDPIPPAIKDAVLVLASRAYRERDASYADSVVSAEGGILSYFRNLPPRVQATFEQFRLPVIA